jgi:hypothetical protein
MDLCNIWWPEQYYPNWLPRFGHPALIFTGGCVVWQMLFVDEEWIRSEQLQPLLLRWDPGPFGMHPLTKYYMTAFERLKSRLADALREKGFITGDLLDQLAEAADDDGVDAALHDLSVAISRAYIPLLPGLTTSDWGRLGSMMLEYTDDGLARAACELHAQGQSIRSIGILLGVDRRTVQRWLGPR